MSAAGASITMTDTIPGEEINNELYVAVREKNNAAMSAAFAEGADVDFHHPGFGPGNTALIGASFGGWLEGVEDLLKVYSADINAQNDYGETALVYAASHGFLEVVNFLLRNQCNPYIETRSGETAMTRAEKYNYTEIAQAIESDIERRAKRQSDVESFLERMNMHARCWDQLKAEAITDMATLGALSQNDLRSIGVLLGDASRITRHFADSRNA